MKFSKKLAGAAAIGAVAVLTFGGTAANAAQGDPVTLTPQITLGAESFTVSGDDCVSPDGTPGEFAVRVTVGSTQIAEAGTANADGTWSTTIASPAESGVYPVYAECDQYAEKFYYAANEALVSKAAGVQLEVAEAKHFQYIDFSGAGYTPKENVRIEFRQNGVVMDSSSLGAVNAVGEFEGWVRLGNTLAAGAYDVVFVGETSGAEYSAPLTITSDGTSSDDPVASTADTNNATPAANIDPASTGAKGSLATTGGENLAPLAIAGGAAALALGAGAVALGRRKARASA